jgi:hypothetical protein
MIQKEANWGRHTYNRSKEELMKEIIKSTLSPFSNSLIQADREYFNIVKTEGGLSQFTKENIDEKDDTDDAEEKISDHEVEIKASRDSDLIDSPSTTIPHFLYHKVYTDNNTPVL